jgi:hypothetical protein
MAPETPTIDFSTAFLPLGPDSIAHFDSSLDAPRDFNLREALSAAPKPLDDEDDLEEEEDEEDDEDEDEEEDDEEEDEDYDDEEDDEEDDEDGDEDDEEEEDDDEEEPLITKRR